MISFTKVKLPFGWLGNMSPFPVLFGGVSWPTTEHLFQALRFPSGAPIREEIRVLGPLQARRGLGRRDALGVLWMELRLTLQKGTQS